MRRAEGRADKSAMRPKKKGCCKMRYITGVLIALALLVHFGTEEVMGVAPDLQTAPAESAGGDGGGGGEAKMR